MTMADTVAVMNHGRVEQMGGPVELYDLPRTAFVANFVGQSNLGEGRVTGRDGDHIVAEVAGTSVKIHNNRTFATGDRLLFGIRPEKVHIGRTPKQSGGMDVKATVLDVSFLGVATSYLVRVPSGATWSVYEQNMDVEPLDLRPGDDVWLSWDPGHAFAVPVEDQP